jgi:DNA-binding response OmpR family regulator
MAIDRRRILWADDEIELLRPHIKFLEQKGFQVTPVSNGDDALAELERSPYDVVLLDEMMPGRGGLDTLETIQSRELSVPVILVTKSEEESLMNEAIGRSISDYLIKPVNPSQVFLACKRVLDGLKLQDSQRMRDYVGEMQRWQQLDLRTLSVAEWIQLALDIARWDVRFDEASDEGLQQSHTDFHRGLNIEFARFVEQHYPSWARGEAGRPLLSSDVVAHAVVPHLREKRRVVFIVIDCMRLDQWLALEPIMDEWFTVERELYMSVLPTATPYSRNAIFAGLLPAGIWKQHPELWQEGGPNERTKNRHERQLLELQLQRHGVQSDRAPKYAKIYDADEAHQIRRQITTFSQVPLVSLVFNFIDMLAHGRSESELLQELAPDEAAFRAVMKAWFTHSALFDIFKSLASQDCVVVVTSDHGAVLGRRAALVYGDRETSTNLRYKYGVNLNTDSKQAVILRRPMEFMLPDDGINKNYLLAREDFYFVYPTRFHEFERQYRGSFQHGGVSLEEMVLPLVTLKPKRA